MQPNLYYLSLSCTRPCHFSCDCIPLFFSFPLSQIGDVCESGPLSFFFFPFQIRLASFSKKDYTAALTHTCSPRVALTHMLLCDKKKEKKKITTKTTLSLFQECKSGDAPLKKQSVTTNRVNPGIMHDDLVT